MTGNTTIPKVSRLEVIQTGARRRWTLEEKLRIVAESFSGPRQVSCVARRHGVRANVLFLWRRLYREGKLGAPKDEREFVPAVIAAEAGMAAGLPLTGSGRIEIVLSEPRRLIVVGADAADIARLIAAIDCSKR